MMYKSKFNCIPRHGIVQDYDLDQLQRHLRSGCNLQIHSDGGLRKDVHASASWTVHAYSYRPDTGLWSASLCVSKGILLDASTSSFLAEALALESALEFVDSFL